jgi:hypothetical protein
MSMPALNWVAFGQAVSWDQANAIANATGGGRLLINDHDPAAGANWPSDLADSIDEATRHEVPSWFGISAVAGGGYQWVDGTPVDPAWAAQQWFPDGDPNADGNPNNDTQHPVLIGGPSWASLGDLSETDVRQAFIEYVDTESVHGTSYDDTIIGGGGPGETVRTFGGDDSYFGLGGGKIYLGAGDDRAIIGQFEFPNEWITGPFPTVDGLVFDGPGNDLIVDARAVQAAIDGDDDVFLGAARVSYRDATGDLVIDPNIGFPGPGPRIDNTVVVMGAGVGFDQINTLEVVGGSGDDNIRGIVRIQGGAGDDYLYPWDQFGQFPDARLYAEGGAGNDTLAADIFGAEMRGGAGDDLFFLDGECEVSGGPGNDRFVWGSVRPTTVVDLSSDDLLDLSRFASGTGEELIDQGYLKVSYDRGYTILSFDLDGGGDEFELLARLKGSFSQSFIEDVVVTGSGF